MSNLLAPTVDQATIDQLEAAYAAPSATPRPIGQPVHRATADADATMVEDQPAKTSFREYLAMTIALTMVFGFVALVVLASFD